MGNIHSPAILYPLFALAGLTAIVQLLIPVARVRPALCGTVAVADFKYGESTTVPAAVSIPNRNYMNLLEFPLLAYVACLMAYAATTVTPLMVQLAWAYVGLRVLHTAIHLSYNHVAHRALAFGVSNAVLVVLWIQVGLHL